MSNDEKTPEEVEEAQDATLLPPREVMSLLNPAPGADGIASLGGLGGADGSPMSGIAPTTADSAGSTADHAQTLAAPHEASDGAHVSDQPQSLSSSSSDSASSQT
jgi:hypothetical protein